MIDLATRGHVEVICGPMFSGKTEELIKRLRRARIARQRVLVFKPRIDDRYDASDVVSHSAARIDSVPVSTSAEIDAQLEWREGVGRLLSVRPLAGEPGARLPVYVADTLTANLMVAQRYRLELTVRRGGLLHVNAPCL